MAITDETTSRTQSTILSPRLISVPNILRWKARGKITHIVKQRLDPMRAMIRSKNGKTIAMKIITAIVTIRIAPLRVVRRRLFVPWAWEVGGIALESRPQRTSIVPTIGRQLKSIVSLVDSFELSSMPVLKRCFCQWNDSDENNDTHGQPVGIPNC